MEVNTMENKNVHIRVTNEIHKKLAIESSRYNETIKGTVERILEEYFNKKDWDKATPEIRTVLTRLIEHENQNTKILKDAISLMVENNQLTKENKEKLEILIQDNQFILGYDKVFEMLDESENL